MWQLRVDNNVPAHTSIRPLINHVAARPRDLTASVLLSILSARPAAMTHAAIVHSG